MNIWKNLFFGTQLAQQMRAASEWAVLAQTRCKGSWDHLDTVQVQNAKLLFEMYLKSSWKIDFNY